MTRECHVQFWESVGLQCPALLAYLKQYQSMREARAGLVACFRFFNDERPHQALEDRTPVEVYATESQWPKAA